MSAGKPWTAEEVARAQSLRRRGRSYACIAGVLHRSSDAVRVKLDKVRHHRHRWQPASDGGPYALAKADKLAEELRRRGWRCEPPPPTDVAPGGVTMF